MRSIGPADLDSLAARIDASIASLQNDGVSLVSTTMPQTLVNVAEGLAAAKSLVLISGLQLLLLAAAALALAGRLLASHRDEESALLAARGAARWQLVRPSLTEGAARLRRRRRRRHDRWRPAGADCCWPDSSDQGSN